MWVDVGHLKGIAFTEFNVILDYILKKPILFISFVQKHPISLALNLY